VLAVWLQQKQRTIRVLDAYREHVAAEKDPDAFDWSTDRAELMRQIDAGSSDFIHQLRLIHYFELGFSEDDSLMARRVLDEVPPSSPVWSLVWIRENVFMTIGRVARAPREAIAYADRVVEEHGDPDVRASFLFSALSWAREAGDSEAGIRYYTRLMEEFPESPSAHMAKSFYGPDNQIKPGNAAPKFALTSFTDSTVTYTHESFRGKVYLIDVWAVWCGPCIREMKYLHEAHDAYKDKGFTILSVSLDREPEDVIGFRKEKWPMPWHHAFIGQSHWNEAAKVFEVGGIPRPILIDANGVIVATDSELRGAKLNETLARVFE
jgi:thiol-disulfide isomerase/thioredoxin